MIYLIGSLKNPRVPEIAIELRTAGFEVFDEWYSAGPEADDWWQAHCTQRGMNYQQALESPHAETVFAFDLKWIHAADAVVLILPAGKSAHLELGYAEGIRKRTAILLDGEPARFDVMYKFVDFVAADLSELVEFLAR